MRAVTGIPFILSLQDRRRVGLVGPRCRVVTVRRYGGHVSSPGRGCAVPADWLERVLLAASNINLTSRALISGRFYTCTNAFQMLQ